MTLKSKAKLYNNFTDWIEDRTQAAKVGKDSIWNTGAKDWAKETLTLDELQSAYLESLTGESPVGDAIAIRLQAAHVKACRRASRLRHETIPRLLTHGNAEQITLVNGLYQKVLTDRSSRYIAAAKNGIQEKLR